MNFTTLTVPWAPAIFPTPYSAVPLLRLFIALLVFLLTSIGIAGDAVVVYFKLSPAGSFEARTKQIQGHAMKKGNGYFAEGIKVNLNSLQTKMKLRDQHMKEKYLETQKYPTADLIFAEGKNGKGQGKLKVRGIEKPIQGTYTLENGGKSLKAKFSVKLSDYDITGVRYMGVGVKDEALLEVTVPVK